MVGEDVGRRGEEWLLAAREPSKQERDEIDVWCLVSLWFAFSSSVCQSCLRRRRGGDAVFAAEPGSEAACLDCWSGLTFIVLAF